MTALIRKANTTFYTYELLPNIEQANKLQEYLLASSIIYNWSLAKYIEWENKHGTIIPFYSLSETLREGMKKKPKTIPSQIPTGTLDNTLLSLCPKFHINEVPIEILDNALLDLFRQFKWFIETFGTKPHREKNPQERQTYDASSFWYEGGIQMEKNSVLIPSIGLVEYQVNNVTLLWVKKVVVRKEGGEWYADLHFIIKNPE